MSGKQRAAWTSLENLSQMAVSTAVDRRSQAAFAGFLGGCGEFRTSLAGARRFRTVHPGPTPTCLLAALDVYRIQLSGSARRK